MHRIALLVLALACTAALAPGLARAATSQVVVSQLFAGGGNTGAPYTHDYVELFNRGAAIVDVSGWSVQYATAAGTTWQVAPIAGTIPAGGRYLVQLASGGTSGAALPTADATGTAGLANGGGKLALVRGADALSCGAAVGSCAGAPLLEDFVGWGGAADYEGSGPAPALTNTTALVRAGGGCADTDVNAADFSSAAPSPRNSAALATTCAVAPPAEPQPGAGADASVDVEIEPLLSIALERQTLSFGKTVAGAIPPPISEQVTVRSTNTAGYTLNVGRSVVSPADLPLALQASGAPAGAWLGSALSAGSLAGIPIGASTLDVGTAGGPSAAAGDVWPTSVGFAGPLPVVPPGRYTATLTFTVIGR